MQDASIASSSVYLSHILLEWLTEAIDNVLQLDEPLAGAGRLKQRSFTEDKFSLFLKVGVKRLHLLRTIADTNERPL
jgi:hypothetical protein